MSAILAPPRRPAPPADPPPARRRGRGPAPRPAAASPPPTSPPQPEGAAAVVIPASALTYEGFRAWTRSETFPDHGRIDYLRGDLFVDLMAERFEPHGLPKQELSRVLGNRAVTLGTGEVLPDGTRIALPGVESSFEPDLAFLTEEAVRSGRVRLVPTADGDATVEFAGPPDLVAEIVSPSSEHKDEVRLPAECFAGGVTEYWLVDCRGDGLVFLIHRRAGAAFEPVEPDGEGFVASEVLGRSYRLTRTPGTVTDWRYRLEER